MNSLQPALLFILLFISIQGNSQDLTDQQLFSENGVCIHQQLTDCIDNKNGTAKQYLFLQVINTTENAQRVSFKKELWYAGKCLTCDSDSDEYTISIDLDPGQSVSSNCENHNSLSAFVRMLNLKNVRQLTHFELKNIQVTEL